ncbi:aminotransferase class V-fold PLP-dependent enzyme [Azotobacter vinelandii]
MLAEAFGNRLQPGDEIIVTNQDHEANNGVWRRLAKRGIVIKEWQVNPSTGSLNTEALQALLSTRTKVVAFTHCSNILGEINPVRKICEIVHAAGALAVVDGVSYAGHGLPDVSQLGADIYLFLTVQNIWSPSRRNGNPTPLDGLSRQSSSLFQRSVSGQMVCSSRS